MEQLPLKVGCLVRALETNLFIALVTLISTPRSEKIVVSIELTLLLPAYAVAANVSSTEKTVQYSVASNNVQHTHHKAGGQGSKEPQTNVNENSQEVNADGENLLGCSLCVD